MDPRSEAAEELGPNVTLAQKKRLAVLAKMGLGPIGEPKRHELWESQQDMRMRMQVVPRDISPPTIREAERQAMARKARMLEMERIKREQEERQERERREEEQRIERRRGGLKPLGMVLAREESTVPELAEKVQPLNERFPAKIGVKSLSIVEAPPVVPELVFCSCGQQFVQGAKFCSECGARRPTTEELVAAAPKQERERRFQEAKPKPQPQPQVQQQPKKKAKKRKRKKRNDDDVEDEEGDWEDDDDEELETIDTEKERDERRERLRGGEYRNFVADSVKGKVSHDNKGFTDAELERRFNLDQQSSSSRWMMSEQEALALVRQEKKDRGVTSGAKRAQREHAEWLAYKAERMQRRSRSREHLVVARK